MKLGPALALVVVLGDLGRSPRMLAHARALRLRGWAVALCGHADSALPQDVRTDAGVTVHDLGRGALRGALNLAHFAARLPWRLAVVQNPPGFPAVLALTWARGARNARIVLDWHNTGAELLVAGWPWRQAYAAAETFAARWADTHLAVTLALKRAVQRRIGIVDIRVLRDAPGETRPAGTPKFGRAAWWRTHAVVEGTGSAAGNVPLENALWVVCPSSWGPDEAMEELMDVATNWSLAVAGGRSLALIATGKGARRAAFVSTLAGNGNVVANEKAATVHVAWFSPEDYRELLARADAGLCLHTSSSGLDFPMKLVDFAAAGLPALACDYGPALREAFPAAPGDATFRNERELRARLTALATGERTLRETEKPARTWSGEWNQAAPDVAAEGTII